MFYLRRAFGALLTLTFLAASFPAQKTNKRTEIVPPAGYAPIRLAESLGLRSALESAVNEVTASRFKPNEIAATLIDLSDAQDIRWANVNGELALYPASVVKMFYMVALHRQLEDKKVTPTKELQRGLRDMIVDSSNEATQYILDVLTDTSSGAELPKKQFDAWQFKRNRVNRYLSAMGYTGINVNQKTFCEDAYGIEQQSRNYRGENRNMLTTNATARMLAEIVIGRVASPERTRQMMGLMKRDPWKRTSDTDDQSTGFTGRALIEKRLEGARLWSKAGWTSRSRHDAAYIELPDGRKFVLVIFTENHANERDVIPSITGRVIEKLGD